MDRKLPLNMPRNINNTDLLTIPIANTNIPTILCSKKIATILKANRKIGYRERPDSRLNR